jgi:aminopeptidase N
LERWDRIDRRVVPLGLPAHAFTEQDYGPIIYGRGPLFIEALANEMGQEALDAALRDYVDTYRWETTTGEGLRTIAERRCACDLAPVFSDWVYPQ